MSKSVSKVVVVGAGFSKALSDLPVISDLETSIEDSLLEGDLAHLASLAPAKGTDETTREWLSRLTTPDIWLPDYRRSSAHALAAELIELIARQIFEQQLTKNPFGEDSSKVDPALERLVAQWFVEPKADAIISLNYDTLIERSLNVVYSDPNSRPRTSHSGGHTHYRMANPFQIPHWSGQASALDGTRLLKLHGSLNWWIDSVGSRIVDVGVDSEGCSNDPGETWWGHQAEHAPGTKPLLVPPVATQHDILKHPILRQIWEKAWTELMAAAEVHVVGYSVPAEDRMMFRLLRQASQAEFVVVNRSTEELTQRLESHGLKVKQVFSGERSVQDYADSCS